MTAAAYISLGLTFIAAFIIALLAYAAYRFVVAARQGQRSLEAGAADSRMLASALEEAFERLKQQERASAARAAASERLSSEIITSLTSGVIVVNHDGEAQLANPAAARILHLNPAAVIDLAAIPALQAVIGESLAAHRPVTRREIAIEVEGVTRHLGVTVSPLNGDGAQGAHGAICLFSDLTSVVAMGEQLRLKEALARVGELTAGLAHEFRNGLATIHGYARLLNPESLPEAQRPYLEEIRAETHALGEVVTNFLRFARPEPLNCAPVDLRALIERAAADTPAARVSLSGDFATVFADDVLLRQAVSNLFRNSVEACRAAGREPLVDVVGRNDDGDGCAQVVVSDNGPGIDPAVIDKIFQPFFTTGAHGTGLGLAIVQKVIVSHNGRVSASNAPGGGAVFTLSLPLFDPLADRVF